MTKKHSSKQLEQILLDVKLGDMVHLEARGMYKGEAPNLQFVGVVHDLDKEHITIAPYNLSSTCSGAECPVEIKSIKAVHKLYYERIETSPVGSSRFTINRAL